MNKTSVASACGWSPLITHAIPSLPPGTLTEKEEQAVMELLDAMRPRPVSVTIGTSRDTESIRNAHRLAATWQTRGGTVFDILDLPEHAASWLRQARRFTRETPDAWIITGRLPGWVQMGRRLALSTEWDPARTVATASLAHDGLIIHGGIGTFDHLRGAHRDGRTWEIIRTLRIDRPHTEHTEHTEHTAEEST
ncbi:hypothetical protein [Streptomyces sp. AK02-01A]|uniref:hypothetical protein n=1 Tax=Streptomyces sp. AK02-01A TaxID=3028648 RepID=UPI0029B60120|nr:hypothetical protein [Streptomyces sp. AK02-01A]MDX3853742.1 hypothetical protein [Streptomyces sp. AK02-01A]